HETKAFHDAVRERRIYATAQDHGNHTGLYLAKGVPERVSGGCAAGGHNVAHAAQSEMHTYFAREGSHGAAGNAEQTHAFYLALKVEAVLLLAEIKCASPSAENDAYLLLLR